MIADVHDVLLVVLLFWIFTGIAIWLARLNRDLQYQYFLREHLLDSVVPPVAVRTGEFLTHAVYWPREIRRWRINCHIERHQRRLHALKERLSEAEDISDEKANELAREFRNHTTQLSKHLERHDRYE